MFGLRGVALAALGGGLDVGLCFCFDGAEVGDVAVEVALVFAEEAVAFALLGERLDHDWEWWFVPLLTCSSGVGPMI